MPWTPLPTPDGDPAPPRRLSDSLDRVLAGLGRPSVDVLDVLRDRWEELVGPAAAEALRPLGIEHGTLVVAVSEPAWASHVRWLGAELVARAGEVLGPGVVTAVEARVRPR
jgi:hypothetical protein